MPTPKTKYTELAKQYIEDADIKLRAEGSSGMGAGDRWVIQSFAEWLDGRPDPYLFYVKASVINANS